MVLVRAWFILCCGPWAELRKYSKIQLQGHLHETIFVLYEFMVISTEIDNMSIVSIDHIHTNTRYTVICDAAVATPFVSV